MTEGRCRCGRPLLTRPGQIEPTCFECGLKPDSCPCEPVAARTLDELKAVVDEAEPDERPGAAVRAVKKMAAAGMDDATRLNVRAWIKAHKVIEPIAEFDALAEQRVPTRRGKPGYAEDHDMSTDDSEPDEPWRELGPAELAGLLDTVEAKYRSYIAWSDKHQAVAVTLFTMHTHVFDAADTTPYLNITSPVPESGKTRVEEVAALLVARPWRVIAPSEAVLFRKIDQDEPTLLLDESDLAGLGKEERGALLAILHEGYRRGGSVPRCVGDAHTVVDFPVFCPKALAGMSGLPDALTTRCIPIRLRRRAPSETVRPFYLADAEAELKPLRKSLGKWATKGTIAALRAARPSKVPELSDRQCDIWEPLLAIADAAGERWARRAREAAVALHGAERADDTNLGELLLRHISDGFDEGEIVQTAADGGEYVSTTALLDYLIGRDDGPWAGFWEKDLNAFPPNTKGPAARLARLLRPFGVEPTQIRTSKVDDKAKVRGYRRTGFDDAFTRYLPARTGPTPEKDGTSVRGRSAGVQGKNGDHGETASDLRRTDVPTSGGGKPVREAEAPPRHAHAECAAPGCTTRARRGCRTCWEHAGLDERSPND